MIAPYYKWCLLLPYLILCESLYSQDSNLVAKDQTKRQVAWEYIEINHDSAICLINELLTAEKNIQSYAYAELLSWKGCFYRKRDSFELAQEKLFQALKIATDNNYNELTANINNNIGNLFYSVEYFDKTLPYYESALNYYKHIDVKDKFLGVINNIGAVYEQKNQYQKALQTFRKGLAVQDDSTINTVDKANLHLNLSSAFINTDELDSARYYLNSSDSLFTVIGDKEGKIKTLYNLAYTYELEGAYDKARRTYHKTLKMAHDNGVTSIHIKSQEGLFFIHTYLGNTDSIIDHYLKLTELKEAQAARQLEETLYDIEARYQTKKKEEALKNEKILKQKAEERAVLEAMNKEQRTYLLSGIIFIILIIAIAIYFYFRQKAKLAKLKMERQNEDINNLIRKQETELYQAQLEGENEERQRISRELHDSVGGMLAAINLHASNLQNDNNKESTEYIRNNVKHAIQEVRNISHNLRSDMLFKGLEQSLKTFINGINASGKVNIILHYYIKNSDLDNHISNSIFNIVKELISNALKHANANKIHIQLMEHEDQLQLMYEDDGKGFDPAVAATGIGIRNMKERVRKFEGTFVVDSSKGKGTVIIIEIPYES